VSLIYVAYSSFDLQSANSIQTFLTCRSLLRAEPAVRIVLPKSPRRVAQARGMPVTFLNKLPLRWLAGDAGERLERKLYASRAAAFARRIGWPVYTRDVAVAARCAAAGLVVGVEVHDLTDAAAAMERAACIVTLNETIAARLRVERPSKRVEVVSDAFDSAVFHPRAQAPARAAIGVAPDAFVVGYAGLTFAGRGVDLLVGAFDRLEAFARRRLMLIGGAAGEVTGLNVAGRADVIAPGRLPAEDVARWLAAADVLVIPDAIGGAAASPLKMFEYAALEIPIVAPERAEIREVLGDRGCYFTPRDRDSLAAALHEVAENRQRWRERAGALREALAAFDYDARARRILSLMRQATA
jgi:glycosyltransferase involved in cell wall biosynthesis